MSLEKLIEYAEQERNFTGADAAKVGFVDELIDDLPADIKISDLD